MDAHYKEKVVIVIPTYNEALGIENTIHQVFKATAPLPDFETHILIFDSASQDDTQMKVKALQFTYPHLHLQTEPQKTGLGSAYYQAMQYALDALQADIVGEFDADLSHQPCYLPPMLETLKHADVVVGSRYVPGGSIPQNWGFKRKLLSRLGNKVAQLALSRRYQDLTSGFRLTRREALLNALPHGFISKNYAYKIELFWRLHLKGAMITEYPIAFIDRTLGESKLPSNSIKDSLRVLYYLQPGKLRRYIKMCAVGFLGLFYQVSIYNLLSFWMSPYLALKIGVTVAIINNFLLNDRFTFKHRLTHKLHQKAAFALFVSASILMIAFQNYWLHLGIKTFGRGMFKENLIIFSGVVLGSILNYLTYEYIIWRKRAHQPMAHHQSQSPNPS